MSTTTETEALEAMARALSNLALATRLGDIARQPRSYDRLTRAALISEAARRLSDTQDPAPIILGVERPGYVVCENRLPEPGGDALAIWHDLFPETRPEPEPGCTCGWAPTQFCDLHHAEPEPEPESVRQFYPQGWFGGYDERDDLDADRRCAICGEQFLPDDSPDAFQGSDERAEMYDPMADQPSPAVVCHAQCGLSAGLAVA